MPTTTALEKLSEWLPFAKNNLSPPPSASTSALSQLNPSQLSFQSSSEHPETDDSPDPARWVRVVSVAPGWREKFPSSGTPEARQWLKRQWDIASIVVKGHRQLSSESTLDLSNLDPDPSVLNQGVLADLGDALGELGNELSRALRRST